MTSIEDAARQVGASDHQDTMTSQTGCRWWLAAFVISLAMWVVIIALMWRILT